MSGSLPSGKEKETAVRQMFDRIAPRYDLVNRVMTFGMDVGWRRKAVRSLELESGDLVGDVACGTGDFCREIEAVGGRAVGFDLSLGMLHAARTNAPLVQADALAMPLRDGSLQGVTCGFALRNVVDISALFGEFARVLGPGGRVAILEVAEPRNRLLKAGHRVYFHKVVPFVGGLLSDRAAYRYLPESTAYLPSEDGLRSTIEAAGFSDVGFRRLGLGAAQLITAMRRAS
jgi:demethylmenaquinone methyltransferase/2-methoxy-6-polyprenyl-1,4-benzoquinol methylase